MHYLDTHFHLDLWKSPSELISNIESQKIYTIAVTNAPSVFKLTLQLTDGLKYIRPALGYHPEVLIQRPYDLPLFKKYINQTKYIGEIGLDYSCNVDKKTQQSIFSEIISDCSNYNDKVITVHSRGAETDLIQIINKDFPNTIILHWYSGSIQQLKTAIDYGFYFSVNFQMTQTKNGKLIIKNIPLDRLLTESDGPFVKINNEANSPLFIKNTLSELAKIFNLLPDEIMKIVYNNFCKILTKNS